MLRFFRSGLPVLLALAVVLLATATVMAQSPVNLARSATGSSSSDWNADFSPPKANDGDMTTRWNAAGDDVNGSWLAYTWDTPQTFNKVIVRQAFDRITKFHVEVMDPTTKDWKAVYESPTPINPTGDPNPVFTIVLKPAVTSTGVRLFIDEATICVSIFEIEVYNVPQGTIKGVVKDEAGKPVEGAVVAAGTNQTLTNDQGVFELLVDAGTYDVTASKPGAFRTKTARGVSVQADATVSLDFALVALPPNLALAATPTSSSHWSEDYDALKATDGNLQTRWNSAAGDVQDSYLALEWKTPQTFNKVTIREAFDRIREYVLQTFDLAKGDWVDAFKATVPVTGGNPVLVAMLPAPITANQLRLLITQADAVPSVFELEVSNAPTGTLSGKVTDFATGKPVANAAIVVNPGGPVATTDPNGTFSTALEVDEYLVYATAEGYLDSPAKVVAVAKDKPADVALQMAALGENLSTKATAAASTDDGMNLPEMVNDGDLTTAWMADPEHTKNQWIALNWDKETTFRMVALRSFRGVIQKSRLEILDASGNWAPIPNTEFNPEFTGPSKTFLFDEPITTKAVRYFIFYTNHDTNVPGLSEMDVYNPPIIEEAPSAVLLGDVNGDGKLGIPDATIALQIAVGILKDPTPQQIAAGDINKNGKIDIPDVTKILRAAVGLDKLS
ncbi:MAG: discoidin domain-containing protein [Armatimonadota bacterium]